MLIVGSVGLLKGEEDVDDEGEAAESKPELPDGNCGVEGVDLADLSCGGKVYICASLTRLVSWWRNGTAKVSLLSFGFESTIISLFFVGESPIRRQRFFEFLFCIE